MALMTRMTRLLRADLHAVLDRVEEPEVVLRQAVREMEDALGEDRRRAKLLGHERTRLATRAAEIGHALHEIAEQLDVCFDAGNDGLARTLLRRRLESERGAAVIERRLAAVDRDRTQVERRIEENRRRLDAMRQKADLLAEEEPAAERDDAWSGPDCTVTDDDVEVAFLREQRRRRPS